MNMLRLFTLGMAAMLISANAMAAELRVGLKSEPSSIDPHYHNLGPNNAFATQIFSSLVGSDENQQYYPDLACHGLRSTIQPGSSSFVKV